MKTEYKALGNYGTLGIEIVLCLAFGFFGGRWLDGRLNTDPYLSILGFFFGAGAAVKAIHRTWKDMQKVAAQEEREQGNPAPLYDPPERKRSEDRDSPLPPEHHDERS
jgi:ATP synthase protein I